MNTPRTLVVCRSPVSPPPPPPVPAGLSERTALPAPERLCEPEYEDEEPTLVIPRPSPWPWPLRVLGWSAYTLVVLVVLLVLDAALDRLCALAGG